LKNLHADSALNLPGPGFKVACKCVQETWQCVFQEEISLKALAITLK